METIVKEEPKDLEDWSNDGHDISLNNFVKVEIDTATFSGENESYVNEDHEYIMGSSNERSYGAGSSSGFVGSVKMESDSETEDDEETDVHFTHQQIKREYPQRAQTDEGFIKGQSDNLPKISGFVVANYFSRNPIDKTEQLDKTDYGDESVDHVQIKRLNDICTVKCIISPDVEYKPHHCLLEYNEKSSEIIKVLCDNCKKNCQHTIAVIMWLHRRSEESDRLPIRSYWNELFTPDTGPSRKYILTEDFGTVDDETPNINTSNFFNEVINKLIEKKIDCPLARYYREKTDEEKMSIHYMICIFQDRSTSFNVDEFISFCTNEMKTIQLQSEIKKDKPELWFELLYGRIRDKRMYEISASSTESSILIEEILETCCFDNTANCRKRRILKRKALDEVVKIKKLQNVKSGLVFNDQLPTFVAAIDGMTREYVIEIKCVCNKKPKTQYYNDDIGMPNIYFAQIQSQMHISGKQKGLFCIVYADFENSKQVDMFEVPYNRTYCEELFAKCESFWKKNIYNVLIS